MDHIKRKRMCKIFSWSFMAQSTEHILVERGLGIQGRSRVNDLPAENIWNSSEARVWHPQGPIYLQWENVFHNFQF